jgi:hypothetical protein
MSYCHEGYQQFMKNLKCNNYLVIASSNDREEKFHLVPDKALLDQQTPYVIAMNKLESD